MEEIIKEVLKGLGFKNIEVRFSKSFDVIEVITDSGIIKYIYEDNIIIRKIIKLICNMATKYYYDDIKEYMELYIKRESKLERYKDVETKVYVKFDKIVIENSRFYVYVEIELTFYNKDIDLLGDSVDVPIILNEYNYKGSKEDVENFITKLNNLLKAYEIYKRI